MSGHVSSMNRTFIVEEYAEDDFAPMGKDEVTGEQGHVDDERSCFWTWDGLAVQTIQRPPTEKKKRKGKRKAQRQIQKKRKSIPWLRTNTRF